MHRLELLVFLEGGVGDGGELVPVPVPVAVSLPVGGVLSRMGVVLASAAGRATVGPLVAALLARAALVLTGPKYSFATVGFFITRFTLNHHFNNAKHGLCTLGVVVKII